MPTPSSAHPSSMLHDPEPASQERHHPPKEAVVQEDDGNNYSHGSGMLRFLYNSEPLTGEMWKIYFQCKGKPEDDEFIDVEVERAHISFYNLVYFKEQLGYGARDFLYYKKRCGRDVARLQAIEYLRHAEAMLQDNAAEREIRLVLSMEPELEENVSITPIKKHGGKRKHDESGTYEHHDAYKVWLAKLQAKEPDIDYRDDFRDETIETYKEWLRHTGSRRHMLSLLEEHTDDDHITGVEGNQERRMANKDRPAHARKPKQQANGGSKTHGRGCLKGFKAATKRIKSGSQKLKIEFDPLLGGPYGENSRTFVDEIVMFTRKKAPLIGVQSWKDVKDTVKIAIAEDVLKIWDLDDIEDASEKIWAIAKERYKGWRASFSSTYKAYSTDAQRMKHKPEDLDNVEWYYLIQYFGSEGFQKISIKNAGVRQNVKTKHLTGSKPFSQISFEQRNQGNGQQPTDLQLWMATHTKDGQWSNEDSRDVYENACIQVTEAEKGKDRPFLTVEEENAVFQLNYSKTLGIKSYRCHGRGYMAKYPTRSALLKHREEDAARNEVLARQERMQHQQEVKELKEKLENEVSARKRDKEESTKQIDEIREEFRSTLQQQIQLALQQAITGTINTTQFPKGPSVDNNFITPPRIEDAAIENNEPASVLTIEKVVEEGSTMTKKTSTTRPLFQKRDGANGSLNYVSTQQLLRTRNQKKKQQESAESQNL